MRTETACACGRCGTPVRPGELLCWRCGRPLGLPPRTPLPAAAPSRSSPRSVAAPALAPDEPRVLGLRAPWFFLVLGFVVAPVFRLTPLLGLIGWYLAALVHEMGHCIAGWLVGRPAVPVLGLNAHAMSVEEDFSLGIALAVWAGGLVAAWRFLEGRKRWIVGGMVLVLHPLVAFTGLAALLTITGGHLGELVCAGIFLHRALTGGFTSSPVERGLYAVLGWYLVLVNLWLTGGLVGSEAARRSYAQNGSYGLTNDYLVAAHQLLGTSLETVAAVMTLPALAVVPVTVAVTFLRAGTRRET